MTDKPYVIKDADGKELMFMSDDEYYLGIMSNFHTNAHATGRVKMNSTGQVFEYVEKKKSCVVLKDGERVSILSCTPVGQSQMKFRDYDVSKVLVVYNIDVIAFEKALEKVMKESKVIDLQFSTQLLSGKAVYYALVLVG